MADRFWQCALRAMGVQREKYVALQWEDLRDGRKEILDGQVRNNKLDLLVLLL